MRKASEMRYKSVRALLQDEDIFFTLKDAFGVMPKSIIAKDLSICFGFLSKKLDSPELFTFQEAIKMGTLLRMESSELCLRILKEIEDNKVLLGK